VKFIAFMNTLNLLAFAVKNEVVEPVVVNEFIKNLANGSDFLFLFIREYQDCCNDKLAYRHAFGLLLDLRMLSHQQSPELHVR
jgi:hypothetical protein